MSTGDGRPLKCRECVSHKECLVGNVCFRLALERTRQEVAIGDNQSTRKWGFGVGYF